MSDKFCIVCAEEPVTSSSPSYCRRCKTAVEAGRAKPPSKGVYLEPLRKRQRIMKYWFNRPDLSNKEVAENLGIKHHALLHVLTREDPDRSLRRARKDARLEHEQWQKLKRRMETAKPCLVCGGWILRGEHFQTCSHECTDLWRTARLHLSEEEHHKHRLAVARTILRSPEKHKDVRIRWARKMLSAEAPPPNRRYETASRAAAAAERARQKRRVTETEMLRGPRDESDFLGAPV